MEQSFLFFFFQSNMHTSTSKSTGPHPAQRAERGKWKNKNQPRNIKWYIYSNAWKGGEHIKEKDENTASFGKVAGGRRKRAHHICHHLHPRPPLYFLFSSPPSSSAHPHLHTVIRFSNVSLFFLLPIFIASLFFSLTSLYFHLLSTFFLLTPLLAHKGTKRGGKAGERKEEKWRKRGQKRGRGTICVLLPLWWGCTYKMLMSSQALTPARQKERGRGNKIKKVENAETVE